MSSDLLAKIRSKTAHIGIIGLGYVGLPLAILFDKRGFKVTGFIRDSKKKKKLSEKLSVEVLPSDFLSTCDVYIICVPTPVDEHKNADLTAIEACARLLKKVPLNGKLIVNESTVAPGTTREVFGRLSKTEKYYLACSPERIDPGNKDKTVANIAKVVGGGDTESTTLGVALYSEILSAPVISVSSLETAETVKMLENTFRATNIALVNEFARVCDKNGVDILEVIEVAKSKWSFLPHYPGVGVGGHCIPVDPYYFLEYAQKLGVRLPVISESLQENERMASYVGEKIVSLYRPGKKVLIYGITYKKNVKDVRESPVLALCKFLKIKKIPFSVYDPLLAADEIVKLNFPVSNLSLTDIFVVGTDHRQLSTDYRKCINRSTVVIDGRNFFTKIVGTKVIGVGRSIL